MDNKELILKVLEMLVDDENKKEEVMIAKTDHPFIGRYCVIRTYSAGVHIGTLRFSNGFEIILENARRIYYWKGAFTLHEVALNGVSEGSKLSAVIPEIALPCVEIIPCSDDIAKRFQEYPVYGSSFGSGFGNGCSSGSGNGDGKGIASGYSDGYGNGDGNGYSSGTANGKGNDCGDGND